MKKFNVILVAMLFGAATFFATELKADQFIYEVHCEPTEIEDIARVIQGNIYLALKADKTIQKSEISVRIRKLPASKTFATETELLDGTGYSFNPADLSVSIGGNIVGHACFAPANLLFNLKVTWKSGVVKTNEVTIPIQAPGSYATSGKLVVD